MHFLLGNLNNCSPWVNHSDTHITQFDQSEGTLAANVVDGLNIQVNSSAHRGQLLLSGQFLPYKEKEHIYREGISSPQESHFQKEGPSWASNFSTKTQR